MSEQLKDGGPAFPMYSEIGNLHSEGVSVRDYFAAVALQGMWAGKFVYSKCEDQKDAPRQVSYDDIAAWAYKQANAMLRARSESEAA